MMVARLDLRPFDRVTISVDAYCYGETSPGEKPPQTDVATGGGFTGELSDTEQYFRDHLGAGEGIRTLDPNLGKVVLYP